MIWRIRKVAAGRYRVDTETQRSGIKGSCGDTESSIPEIEAFIFQHAQPNDMVYYPDGRVARISVTALA